MLDVDSHSKKQLSNLFYFNVCRVRTCGTWIKVYESLLHKDFFFGRFNGVMVYPSHPIVPKSKYYLGIAKIFLLN